MDGYGGFIAGAATMANKFGFASDFCPRKFVPMSDYVVTLTIEPPVFTPVFRSGSGSGSYCWSCSRGAFHGVFLAASRITLLEKQNSEDWRF